MDPSKILFLAAEAAPLVKVGGLGDVAGSLPKAISRLALGQPIDIRIVLPYHAAIQQKLPGLPIVASFPLYAGEVEIPVAVHQAIIDDIKWYFISGPPIPKDGEVYSIDNREDGWKFLFFSLAALEFPERIGWRPDIIHSNDWHTALTIYCLKYRKQNDPFYRKIRSVLTIHNLTFMGGGTDEAFDGFGLPPSTADDLPWWAKKMPLPLGLQAADRIVAVSPTYAQEILGPVYGCGLEGFLQHRQDRIVGIVNGLDQDSWNPAADSMLASPFSVKNLEPRLKNKRALAREFNLDDDPSIPLLILISRMDLQKGCDLAIEGLFRLQHLPWQALFLGTGNPYLEESCRELAAQLPTRVRTAMRFDGGLSRRMYAGGDILLMPSRYEPCGLAQMIAMRYGCIPVAHATGGLKDTIIDFSEKDRGTGFLFEEANAQVFAQTLQRALAIFEVRSAWSDIQKRGMAQDFSWEKSARAYSRLYQELLEEV